MHACVVREPRSAFPVTHCSRRAFAISNFRGAGQKHHFKAGPRAPSRLAPRLCASVWPVWPPGRPSPLFALWTELQLLVWNIPTVLGASLYCCVFLWRGSDQHQPFLPADKFRAQSYTSASGRPLASPASISCPRGWGLKLCMTAIADLSFLSSGQCLAGLPDAGLF